MKPTIPAIYSKPIWYWVVSILWNIAILSIMFFIGAFILDIIGSLLNIKALRDLAYGVAIISTVTMFWFVALGWLLSFLVKCDHCNSRLIKALKKPNHINKRNKLKSFILPFIPISRFSCPKCKSDFQLKPQVNSSPKCNSKN